MLKNALYLAISLISISAIADYKVDKVVLSGSEFVISGEGFGKDNPMIFWDDVASFFTEGKFTNRQTVPTPSIWTNNGSKWGKPMVFRNDMESRNGSEAPIYYGEGHISFLGYPKINDIASTTKIYVSWWYNPSSSPSDEGGSNKFIRIWDNANGYGTRISWTQMHLTCQYSEDDSLITWGSWTGNINEWNHHEIYVDTDQYLIETRVNGEIVHDGKCKKHESYKSNPLSVALVGFDHGMSNYQKMTTKIDDIYIGNSEKRLIISNQSTYKPTMDFEILPIISWTNSEIKASIVKGVVKLSNDTYLYMADDKGKINKQGYKINCLDCPKPPIVLP